MSWNILPKANLQYFLQKLKDKFSKVTANPSTTTEILNSIDIDGTSYAIPSASSVTGVKGSNESNYRTGNVNVSANNVGALGVVGNVTVSSLDDLVALCLNSGNNKAFEGPINISTDIGVGMTGWCNTIGACLNAPNNGNSDISLFCLFMSTRTSINPRYAIINGKTTGNYSVTATGVFAKSSDIPDISTKVSKSGDTMTGPLLVNATGGVGSYDEGIRINAGKNGYSTLVIGGAANSTSGTAEGQFWIGTNPTNNSYKRKLYIAQNGSTGSGTYFEAGSSSVTSPSLHMGNTISMNGNDINLNTNGSSSNDTSDIVWWYGNGREKARLWCNDSYTSESGLNFRMFNSSGNQLFTGTIPLRDHTYSVGNGTLTLQRNGSTIASFTANQSGNTTANFTDTNDAVKQTNCGTNNWNLRVLLSGAQDDTERTSSVYKAQDLQYNPKWKALYIGSNNRTWGMVYSQGNQQLNLSASAEENYRLFLGVRESTWSLAPLYNQYLKLGTGSFKWNQIYSSSATINTSDRRKKKDIQPLDENARIFVMKLNPVSYKMKDGETGRTHYGMIAQDIEDELTELGMTAMDFAGFCKDEVYENVKTTKEGFTEVKTIKKPGEYIYGLRYEEFIAPIIKTEQLQQEDINSLKEEISLLKEEIALLKQRLQILEGK